MTPRLTKKHISVVTPCFNEEGNVRPLYETVKELFAGMPQYTYEHIFIDNASKDQTVTILKEVAAADKNVKIIVNSRNFGHIRSSYFGLLQARGEAVISLVADFQDPPALIVDFLKNWEEGYKLVLGVKSAADERALMYRIRSLYYRFVARLAEVELIDHFTGFGLYDRQVIEILKQIDDPYPYLRGLIADIGFESYKIEYRQPKRSRGITKNNFYSLYDIAMLGITSHSKVPLRIATMAGFFMSIMSLIVAFGYLVAKLVFWNQLTIGIAPIIISIHLLASVQLFFIGIIGEYIGAIHTQVKKRPLVIEKERINFERIPACTTTNAAPSISAAGLR